MNVVVRRFAGAARRLSLALDGYDPVSYFADGKPRKEFETSSTRAASP
jgi:hypothetical protein